MAPSFKLTYFNIYGLGEPIRWILKYAKIDFEDERIEKEDWPELKTKTPFGTLPILTINGKQYYQSLAITRFCAKKAKLVGIDYVENLEIDGVIDAIADIRIKMVAYMHEKDENTKESMQASLFNETLPFYLERLDKLAENNNGYLACNKLTWADFYFSALFNSIQENLGTNILENYNNLMKVMDNVVNIPEIKDWIEERPKGAN